MTYYTIEGSISKMSNVQNENLFFIMEIELQKEKKYRLVYFRIMEHTLWFTLEMKIVTVLFQSFVFSTKNVNQKFSFCI